MKIVSAASALPQHYYPQQVLGAALKQYWGDRIANGRLVEMLHTNSGVDGRYLSLPMEQYLGLDTWGKANDVWIRTAEELGQQATCCALTRGGASAQDIGAFFFVSITGVSSPSIDARLVNRLGLSPGIRRVPIFGLGCVGGAAGIARAADYVRAYPNQAALLLSVELCSLTWQRDDLSMANLISCALFGDGAAAVLVAGSECELEGPEIVDTRSTFYPNTEGVMGWHVSEKGFGIVLTPEVPEVVREHLGQDADRFLADHGLTRGDIGCWIVHTGGPKVLRAAEDALGLPEGGLAVSWECLRRTGNLSSASVLLVLEEIMTKRRPEPGTWSVLAAMGPGFCSELVLLRW
ncbi:MAG TPA: 3-oxoacyl-[acyl-carrier-protein] synthase III C-terminal domain-containing protein [Bryobacteraceae bacterium]|nr:3-oxoacyl-[acyl-carrier-protein] synthase III C-terminal domain-containing protein [Bryobacteraceae bacterium]